jgi:Flp pilus assembly protein TadG
MRCQPRTSCSIASDEQDGVLRPDRGAIRFAARHWRRLARDRHGTALLEFALVAAPLMALLIAILETGLLFFAQEILQNATNQAARTIMTGQAQTQGLSSAQFLQNVCAYAAPLSCANIYVNAQTFNSFSGVSRLNPLQNGNVNAAKLNYQVGGPGDIVLVQVFYQWPVQLGPLNFNLANMSGNNNLLVATEVFRNEPY